MLKLRTFVMQFLLVRYTCLTKIDLTLIILHQRILTDLPHALTSLGPCLILVKKCDYIEKIEYVLRYTFLHFIEQKYEMMQKCQLLII